MKLLAVSTTLATADDACRIARSQVERKLAAFSQIEEVYAPFAKWVIEGSKCSEGSGANSGH